MKRITLTILLGLSLTACKKEQQNLTEKIPQLKTNTAPKNVISLMRYSGPDYSQAISITDANKLIESYLSSIDPNSDDKILKSLAFDADTLRTYLNDTTHGRIVTLKFFLAHQPDYIADGNFGKDMGLDARAITMVIVGLDEENHYVYNRDNKVYDHFLPCPSVCTGSATLPE